MNSFGEELEAKCGRIVERMNKQYSAPTPATFVGREIALVLDHIGQLKRHQEKQRKQLMRRELEVGSQILNIQDRVDLIPDWQERTRARDEAKRTLDQLMGQSYRLAWESQTALQRLQGRLLELWNMLDQLAEENGYR
ncbi:hypothetical protein [Bythopirellula polymerisocia]|uniref:Uncharacterized protein n=1 Tax=Bythopirellula polymerisocia TaxID=2528003 RepID=A0A5C6C9N5_9BACT|nr:hypothetical protein [Bythopirellula polymerisocia]TWU21300.1 hypothetical protein Pla144_47100 [Bythopirellula polymerisocia]